MIFFVQKFKLSYVIISIVDIRYHQIERRRTRILRDEFLIVSMKPTWPNHTMPPKERISVNEVKFITNTWNEWLVGCVVGFPTRKHLPCTLYLPICIRFFSMEPSKHTTSFQRCNNVVDVRTTLLQRWNDVVCLLGIIFVKNYWF